MGPAANLLGLKPRAMRLLGILFSIVALLVLATLLMQNDWQGLIGPLMAARPEWLALAVALGLAAEVAKTTRWLLLLGMRLRSLGRVLALVFTARLLNALVPLRAGDLWRIASVTRVEARPLAIAGGSVIVEKLLDGIVLGSISLALIGSAQLLGMRAILLSLAVLAATAAILGLGLRRGTGATRPSWLDRRATAVARILQAHLPHRVKGGGAAILRALQCRRWCEDYGFVPMAGIGVLTLAGMGLGLLVNLAVLRALGLPADLTLGAIMLVSGYAAGLMPSGPGQWGVFELAVSAPLMAFGLPAASSIATAFTLHVVLLAVLGLGGLMSLPLGLLNRSHEAAALGGSVLERQGNPGAGDG